MDITDKYRGTTSPRNSLVITLTASAILAFFAMIIRGDDLPTPEATAHTDNPVRSAAAPAQSFDITAASIQKINADQAVLQTTENATSDKLITAKPDYVSDIEWQVLQGVAQQHAEPDKELTRLVNKLRFTKELELWHTMEASAGNTRHTALANRLIHEIPERVASKDMDVFEARKLQEILLEATINDPDVLHQRIDSEARRLMLLITPTESTSQ
ncbi:MAG TPA: hypothetical protein DF427_07520 [Moraxellaceae bacterium]|nr:hypothetical protein [Moraxellaceae bacterium]